MQLFSNKELYIMNGGNKLYIYKDGFGDVYTATPAEEKEWAKEVIANALKKIDDEHDPTTLEFAIDNLAFHKYPGLEALLKGKIKDTSPKKQIVFATALWRIYRYEKSFDIMRRIMFEHRGECLHALFQGLADFKDNEQAKDFLLTCLEGQDDELFSNANMTIGMWAYTGMPALRDNNLLNRLQVEDTNTPSFQHALEQLKKILKQNFK